jgi:hypothetical protein
MMTKRQRAAMLREFTTEELRGELARREPKSWRRETLATLLAKMTDAEVRAVLDRLKFKTIPQPRRIARGAAPLDAQPKT